MSSIKLDRVWKLFDDVPIVKDLSLEAKDGEFLVLVGASGCGKSTTLRMLAGLETPTYGSIKIDDEDVTLVPPGRRDVAMVFQSYALYPHMSVYKNLAFGPRVRKDPKAEIRHRVETVARVLGLEEYLDRTPNQLSGGQRQRVALGRLMIRSPRLSLLDEPLSNLDAALRVQMRAELVRLQRELKVTTVYVTHDQVEAMTMGDRIAVLDGGILLQVDTPAKLYDEPATEFVGTFIGSPKMNIVPGEVRQDPIITSVSFLGVSVMVERAAADIAGGSSPHVNVGIRPHDLYLAEESPSRCTVHFTACVDLVEPTGSEAFAIVKPENSEVALNVRIPRSIGIREKQLIQVAFDSRDLHLFNPESGARMIRWRAPGTRDLAADEAAFLGEPIG